MQDLLTPRSQSNSKIVEVIKDTLYWISNKDIPNKNKDSIFIFSDQSHKYQPFNHDFGPLHLGEVYRFINKIESAIRICSKNNTRVVVYTGVNPEKQANSVFLICAYQVLKMNKTPEEAFQQFQELDIKLLAFRDSTYDPVCQYKCTILDCLRGLNFAEKMRWFDFQNFNVQEYERNSLKGWGDWNEIVPNKFIAFSGPLSERPQGCYGKIYTPQDYVPLFKQLNVKLVVRLNDKLYDEKIFVKNGIEHLDLQFEDGSAPPQKILEKFMEYVEKCDGAIAVHCKSGLGRTGTLIGMWIMKHYQMKAADFIGWVRIVRPGSIHGPQQNYLVEHESIMHNAGKNSQIKRQIEGTLDLINNPQKKQFAKFESPLRNISQKQQNMQTTVSSSNSYSFCSTSSSNKQNQNQFSANILDQNVKVQQVFAQTSSFCTKTYTSNSSNQQQQTSVQNNMNNFKQSYSILSFV